LELKKSNLHYTRSIPFRVSRVSSVQLRGFTQGPPIKVVAVASRWQRVGDLIGSRFESHTSRIRSRRLTTWGLVENG